VVLGRAGDPRHPRPLGRTTCRPSGSTWSPCRRRVRAATCCGSGSARRSASTARPRPRRRAGQPVARRARDRADAPDQPRGQRGRWSPATTGPGPRAARPPDPVPRTALPALGAAPDVWDPWADDLARGWVAEIEARLRRGRRPRRPHARRPAEAGVRRPRPAARARGRRRSGRRDQGAAARERPAARSRQSSGAELAEARAALDKAELPLKERTKVRAYTYASQRPWGRRAIAAYKRRQG
jgi:hypothetical protein